MIPAYLYYRHLQKKQKKAEMENNSETLFEEHPTNNVGIVGEKVLQEAFHLSGVAIKRLNEDDKPGGCFVNGKLSVVEKTVGVLIEWNPMDEDGWEITGAEEDGEEVVTAHSSPENSISRQDTMKLKFSVDINDLSSFQCVEPRKGDDCAWIRFIGRDGSGLPAIYFRHGGLASFTECLQRYATLKRSARDPHLVLFTDERREAFEQSVSILDLNKDIISRIMHDPYATAMTGLGKVASFVREQVIPSLLDSDEVSAEEQIKLMRELREQQEEDNVGLHVEHDGGFELVTQIDLPPRQLLNREDPVTQEIWGSFKNPDGSFNNVSHLKDLIFRGGLAPTVRCEAWKYLLGVCDWSSTKAENDRLKEGRVKDYKRMKNQWESISADQEERFSEFASHKGLIKKDVDRTDRTHSFFSGDDNNNVMMLNDILMTYCMYNFDLGYVQGMSDFLSPLVVVFKNEVDSFWAFVKLMDKVHGNFEMDQSVIKRQLMDLRDLMMLVNPKFANYLESHDSDDMYFCFRWILVAFKREFCFEDTMRLWEVLWTGRPCKNFLLLVCVAILEKQAYFVIDNKFGLTEILKHINDLSMNININETLTDAEGIFHQLAGIQDKLPSHICNILGIGEGASYD